MNLLVVKTVQSALRSAATSLKKNIFPCAGIAVHGDPFSGTPAPLYLNTVRNKGFVQLPPHKESLTNPFANASIRRISSFSAKLTNRVPASRAATVTATATASATDSQIYAPLLYKFENFGIV